MEFDSRGDDVGYNGSAIECSEVEDELSFFETSLPMVVLAHWIGSRKCTGQRTLDATTARYIRQGRGSIRVGSNCLLGQFPKETWIALVELAEGFGLLVHRVPGRLPVYDRRGFREPRPITVTYEWVTEQTLEEPPLFRQTRARQELRGPMLCFPNHQAQYWEKRLGSFGIFAAFWWHRTEIGDK